MDMDFDMDMDMDMDMDFFFLNLKRIFRPLNVRFSLWKVEKPLCVARSPLSTDQKISRIRPGAEE